MNVNLIDLKIDQDQYVDLGFKLEFAVDFYRFFKLKNKQCLTSILITELVLLILISIVILPLCLIIFRNISVFNDTKQFFITILISFFIWILTNFYLLKQLLQIKSLAKLIEEIDQYNKVIQSFNILIQIKSNLANNSADLKQQETLIEALTITRNSLINALQVEAIFRQHQQLNNPYQLLNQLEEDFTNLMTFDLHSSWGEYETLLNETLEIGISIHKTIKNLR